MALALTARPKQKRYPKRVLRIVERLEKGERLCKQLRPKETGETEITFTFEPSGRRAGAKSAQEAIAEGLLTPAGDGLLGPEYSQTWTA